MYVLAVDLGLRTCGYVVCEVKNLEVALKKEGQIKPNPKEGLPQKLNFIFTELKKEILSYRLSAIIVERLYSHYRHPATLGVLSQAKGVIALLAHKSGIDYFEFSPTRARKALLGKGNVNSSQIKKMAQNLTGHEFQSVHTADAFSLAVAFSHFKKFGKAL